MNTAENALAFINEKIASGHTVYLANAMRVIEISPKTVAGWAKAGRDLFKLDSSGLRVAQGRRYDLIATPSMMLCKLSAK